MVDNCLTQNSNEEIWVNSIKAEGGAYKGCPQNDYSLHFYETGERPQNFIRDYDEDKRFLDYPKLNELIKRKNEVLNKRATPAMFLKADLKTLDLNKLGKYDVILIDPPWEDYYNDKEDKEIWSYDEIADLKIEQLSESCSFIFLWVGSGKGLELGRSLFKKWGFKRCEDIVWIKTNKHSNIGKKSYDTTLFHHTKEHCLVGIKGMVKRGSDKNFIHANIDTDVIVSEELIDSTEKPHELYRIIERFCLGRKRIELFGEDHNRRAGWVTVGKEITNSNFDLKKYEEWFIGDCSYPEVTSYEGGKLLGTTQEIENLRPKSPVRNNVTNSSVNNINTNMLNFMKLSNLNLMGLIHQPRLTHNFFDGNTLNNGLNNLIPMMKMNSMNNSNGVNMMNQIGGLNHNMNNSLLNSTGISILSKMSSMSNINNNLNNNSLNLNNSNNNNSQNYIFGNPQNQNNNSNKFS